MTEAILSYHRTGEVHVETFESASDAIDRGVELLVTKMGSPLHVRVNGTLVATKDDMFLLWEQTMKAAAVVS
jgi:hypothetical protein